WDRTWPRPALGAPWCSISPASSTSPASGFACSCSRLGRPGPRAGRSSSPRWHRSYARYSRSASSRSCSRASRASPPRWPTWPSNLGRPRAAGEVVHPPRVRRLPMLIRFWGTRGSLPAPLGTAGLRRKLGRAVRGAAGRHLDTDEAIERYIEELDFATSHTFGGNTACVQIDVGGPEYVLCDLGSGARELGLSAMSRYRPGVPQVF